MKIKVIAFDLGGTLLHTTPENVDSGKPMAEWPQLEKMPGVDTMLAAISGKYRLCVATNSPFPVEQTEAALERIGIRDYFEHIFNSTTMGVAKPAPEFFRHILDVMHVAPEACVMVGATFSNDIEGAGHVGMRTIWVNVTGASEPMPVADDTIRDLRELPDALGKMEL